MERSCTVCFAAIDRSKTKIDMRVRVILSRQVARQVYVVQSLLSRTTAVPTTASLPELRRASNACVCIGLKLLGRDIT